MLMPRLINHRGSQAAHWNHCQLSYLGTALILHNKREGLLATHGCLSWARKYLPLDLSSGRIPCATQPRQTLWHPLAPFCFTVLSQKVLPSHSSSRVFSRTGQCYFISKHLMKFSCQAKLHRQLFQRFCRKVTTAVTPLWDGHPNPWAHLSMSRSAAECSNPRTTSSKCPDLPITRCSLSYPTTGWEKIIQNKCI